MDQSYIASILDGRVQKVVLGEQLLLPLACEVPEGSYLSPMLFTIYMKLLAEVIRGFELRCNQYAYDTQLYLTILLAPMER